MKRNNRYKAGATLGLVTIGFLVSYPFGGSFWGRLLASACGAAMIGGIADWFAVSALFRRPLGIPFRTAIIPRNREKIFRALSDMVTRDLLTPENVQQTLRRYDIPDLLLRYLQDHGGKDNLQALILKVAADVIENAPPRETGRFLSRMVKENADKFLLAPLLGEILRWTMDQNHHRTLYCFLLDEVKRIAVNPMVRSYLAQTIRRAGRSYEQGMTRRRLFDWVLQYLGGISPEQAADWAIQALLALLEELRQPDHRLFQAYEAYLYQWSVSLQQDEMLKVRVEEWKSRQVSLLPLTLWCQKAILNLQQASRNGRLADSPWQAVWGRKLEQAIQDFASHAERRTQVDAFVKEMIYAWADKHLSSLETIVREHLDQFSNEMLVEFIQTRVGDDLQMIRINGSVVGMAVGVIIFLVNNWL